jgi:predicted dinucleotide-binding enzyme
MKIGIIGTGLIGSALAKKLVKADYKVELTNSRGPESLQKIVKALGENAKAATNAEAAKNKVVILSTRWESVEEVLKSVETELIGKILIDTTNPFINNEKLIDLKDKTSSEIVASLIPGTHVVKAFNSLYVEWLAASPKVGKGKRVVLLSGDDENSKKTVSKLIADLGFAPLDIGSLQTGGALQQAGKPLAAKNLIEI